MINAGFVDFLFTGAAIAPQLLLFTGDIGPALLPLIPLLIAACLVSTATRPVLRRRKQRKKPAQPWNCR